MTLSQRRRSVGRVLSGEEVTMEENIIQFYLLKSSTLSFADERTLPFTASDCYALLHHVDSFPRKRGVCEKRSPAIFAVRMVKV